MVKSNKEKTPPNYKDTFGVIPFKERFPWVGGDLQTLRDTFRKEYLPNDESSKKIEIEIPKLPIGFNTSGNLLALLDLPEGEKLIHGLVLIIHGLGGSSRRQGLRRMSMKLKEDGFAVLRLNLRGAGNGRSLAAGTYSAQCTSDLLPVIKKAREICEEISSIKVQRKKTMPLFGVGISLGGTILLNACLEVTGRDLLDGLVCASSPLDLSECSKSIERPRNKIYQRWLLHRLIKQTISDPFIDELEDISSFKLKVKRKRILTISDFDEAITAPRWGYSNVSDYYKYASPANKINEGANRIPKTLILHSLDDPWVPSLVAEELKMKNLRRDFNAEVVLTSRGGHNGFHGIEGCWGDKLISKWLTNLSTNLN